jgi:hypothetical protein
LVVVVGGGGGAIDPLYLSRATPRTRLYHHHHAPCALDWLYSSKSPSRSVTF